MAAVGLVVNLMAGLAALDEADLRQSLQLALDGAYADGCLPGDLADEECLTGMAEEEAQDASSV